MTLTFGVILAQPTIGPGRTDDALSAFKRALRLFPQFAGNQLEIRQFCLSGSQDPEALRALQVVLAGNSPAHRDVFRLVVSATRDNRAILEMLPPRHPYSLTI